MGLMINGAWQEHEPETTKDGHFERHETAFRNWITPDGRPGPTGQDGFRAGAGRYHLYVSLACPWAHRTLIMRALKGLEQIIPVSVTHWLMAEQGCPSRPAKGGARPRCPTADTSTRFIRGPMRTTRAAPASRCYGTSIRRPSSI